MKLRFDSNSKNRKLKKFQMPKLNLKKLFFLHFLFKNVVTKTCTSASI